MVYMFGFFFASYFAHMFEATEMCVCVCVNFQTKLL